MAGMTLRVTKLHKQKLLKMAADIGKPLSTMIREVAEEFIKSGVVGNRDLPPPETKIPLSVSDDLKSEMVNAARNMTPPMTHNAWLYNVVMEILHKGEGAMLSDMVDSVMSEGNLGKANLSYRKQQHLLTKNIVNQLNTGVVGLNEASTGTGKSLATLVAASVFYAQSKGVPIIIATATRALQNQLMEESAVLNKLMKNPPTFGVLYGRTNFVSPVLAKELLYSDNKIIKEDDLVSLHKWMTKQEKGGQWLIPDLFDVVSDEFPIEAIRLQPDDKDPESQAPYKLAKELARGADVIITSHHMLTLQNVYGNIICDEDIRYAIIDEVHLLEDSVETVLSDQISVMSAKWGAKRLLDTLKVQKKRKAVSQVKKLSASIDELIKAFDSYDGEDILMLVDRGEFHPEMKKSLSIFKDLAETINIPPKTSLSHLDKAALRAVSELRKVSVKIRDGYNEDKFLRVFLTLSPVRKYVRMISTGETFIAQKIKRIMWDKFTGSALLSGTMSTDLANGYSYQEIMNSIGIDETCQYAEETPLVAPWIWENINMHVNDASLSPPSSSDGEVRDLWLQETASLINGLCKRKNSKKNGGILVLCTSFDDIQALTKLITPFERKLIAYQKGDSAQSLLRNFSKKKGNGILLGLGSFWTGVDLPGQLLTTLVITRLPIIPGVSPGLLSRFMFMSKRAGDGAAFASVLLPRAKLMLKQGIGRLIRSPDDHGEVYITDSRIERYPRWSIKTSLKQYHPLKSIKGTEK